ncbi:NAD(P)H-dependent oxidoreductase [Streptomyces sp. NPDC056105]|uniref:NAD(P)H-dependent oxidoreductase n=1 Tax=Streptomyces sp. NPDC056105 TaxID=3345714 RepID=UPI0035E1FBCB
MWWFSAPAILKGWIDRVFTSGFAYGPAVPPPYGESSLPGKRALVSARASRRSPTEASTEASRTSRIPSSTVCSGSPA